MPPDRLPEFLEQEARSYLEAFAAGRPRIEVEPPDVTTAQAWRAIIQVAARIDADLIIIGSHGHSGWDRILGTNASRVADHADRDVLVVHERRPR
jgi:nucleotide-binding universal stress UspA family protein